MELHRQTAAAHELVAVVVRDVLKGAFPDIDRVMLDEIAPAKDRKGHGLWAVRQLDNIDKHNLIIPVLKAAAAGNFIAKSDKGEIFADGDGRSIQVYGHGTSHTIRSFEGKVELYGNTKAAIDVVFGKDQFFVDQSVLPALMQTAQAVSETVFLLRDRYST